MRFELIVLLALIGRIVHLLAEVDELLEVVDDVEEGVEPVVVLVTNLRHEVENLFLTLEGRHGIHLVEGILLEDDIVDDFGLPEDDVVIDRHAVVAQNVDLPGNLLTALHAGYSRYLE